MKWILINIHAHKSSAAGTGLNILLYFEQIVCSFFLYVSNFYTLNRLVQHIYIWSEDERRRCSRARRVSLVSFLNYFLQLFMKCSCCCSAHKRLDQVFLAREIDLSGTNPVK